MKLPLFKKSDKKQTKKVKSIEPKVMDISDIAVKPTIQITKPKTSRLKNFIRKFSVVIGTLLLFVCTLVALFAYDRWQVYLQRVEETKDTTDNSEGSATPTVAPCVNIVDPACWTQAFKPQLLKENDKTGILIVGSDARNNSANIGNTDTLMLMVYDYKTNQAKTISIPRDVFAPYQYKENGPTYYTKINAIFSAGNMYGENHDGSKVLKRTIEKITGEKIQYIIIVHFSGVINGIDALGGIDINVPQDHTDVYPKDELPDALKQTCIKPVLRNKNDHSLNGFCVFSFKKGWQHMDGMTALIYARMRELSTDFDRARRQQEVINAIKNTVLGDTTPLAQKAQSLFNIYGQVKEFVDMRFEVNLETMLAGLDLAEKYKTQGDTTKIILDPNFAGGGVIIKGDASNYNFSDYTFKQVHAKLQMIDKYMDYYKDTPNIYVTNSSGLTWAKDNPMMMLKNDRPWFVKITIATGKNPELKTGVEIIDYSNGTHNNAINRLQKDLAAFGEIKVITATPESGLKPLKGEDIGVYVYPIEIAPTATPSVAPSL